MLDGVTNKQKNSPIRKEARARARSRASNLWIFFQLKYYVIYTQYNEQ